MKNYVKQIKSATSKDQLKAITYDAFKSGNITMKQYDKLVEYSVCREIELGIWPFLDKYTSKENALQMAQKEFGIKY